MTWLNRVSMAVAADERIMPEHQLSPTAMGMVYSAFMITGGCTAALGLLWTFYAKNYPSQHRLVNEAERQEIGMGFGMTEDNGNAVPAASWTLLLHNRSLVLLTIAYAAIGYMEYLF